jgi:hypothetical protein
MPSQKPSSDVSNMPAGPRISVSNSDTQAKVKVDCKKAVTVATSQSRCQIGRLEDKQSQNLSQDTRAFGRPRAHGEKVRLVADIQPWLEELC